MTFLPCVSVMYSVALLPSIKATEQGNGSSSKSNQPINLTATIFPVKTLVLGRCDGLILCNQVDIFNDVWIDQQAGWVTSAFMQQMGGTASNLLTEYLASQSGHAEPDDTRMD